MTGSGELGRTDGHDSGAYSETMVLRGALCSINEKPCVVGVVVLLTTRA